MFTRQVTGSDPTVDAGALLFADPAASVAEPSATDALHRPDAAAAALTVLEPGPAAVEVLGVLFAPRLSDAGLIDALVAIERPQAHLGALQQQLLAEAARRDPDGGRFLREEVACALRVAPVTAQDRLDVATQLCGRLSDTGDLMDAGRLSYTHGRILAVAVESLSDQVTAKVQARVLPRAEAQTPGEFRAAVRRAVAKFDIRDITERHAVAYADRRVVATPVQDGMCDIWMHLAADGAASIMTALSACASFGEPGDTRTVDQRRADAAVEIAMSALADPALPRAHGQRPAVQITVAASTLLGLDEQPAELDGYGPIPAAMARRLSEDPTGTWTRLITDQAGRLLDYQARTYTPPAALAQHVIARDQHCVHPGCRRKARACDLDHRVPYPAGGTNAANLQALCKRHHRMKHHSTWHVTRNPDGTYDWTSPTRHHYRYRPPELPVPTRQSAPSDDDPPPF